MIEAILDKPEHDDEEAKSFSAAYLPVNHFASPGQPAPSMKEDGNPGFIGFYDIANTAWSSELYWPAVWNSTYRRLYRGDPEVTIVRQMYDVWARDASILVDVSDKATGDEKKARDFYLEVLDDLEGGINTFQQKGMATAPFLGWAAFEVVPAMRKFDWTPPGGDPWRSDYDDGWIGIRRLGWRDYSAFNGWGLSDDQRYITEYNQVSPTTGKSFSIDYDRILHLTFGDTSHPYGLSPLEAVWRLERLKYNQEVVFGIGMEKAAGYLSVSLEGAPSNSDLANIRAAAKAILSAQQGNYGVWPRGVTADVIDVTFSAAEALLASIRFYHLLKLQVLFASQWVSISTTAEAGSYAAATESGKMALSIFNATFASIVRQFDDKVGRLLWKWNKYHLAPGTRRPHFTAKEVKADISPNELAQLLAMLAPVLALGEKDMIEIRRHTGFLPLEVPKEPIHDPQANKEAMRQIGLRKDAPDAAPKDAEDDPADKPSGDGQQKRESVDENAPRKRRSEMAEGDMEYLTELTERAVQVAMSLAGDDGDGNE